MSSARARRSGGGGGGRHFLVGGRWRHVPVVDTGCGCRPRRPRQLLMSLPSFLRPSLKPPVPRSTSSHSSSFFPSSASTASFSSSSAATYTTTYSSSSNQYPYYPSSSSHVAGYKQYHHQEAVPVTTHGKQQQQHRAASPGVAARRRPSRKKRYEKMEATADVEEDVGVAVEKESSDPRADFRESMVQMVVEMGLCGWDDLRCMLRRLLALNAPRHHAAILTAFAEVCAQLAAPPPPAAAAGYGVSLPLLPLLTCTADGAPRVRPQPCCENLEILAPPGVRTQAVLRARLPGGDRISKEKYIV